jgi:hypothetical protein
MKLYHTSPEQNLKLDANSDRLFQNFIFAALEPYFMGGSAYVYEIDIDESEVADSFQIFYTAEFAEKITPIVQEFADKYGLEFDRALDLIEEDGDCWDVANELGVDAADMSWDCQLYLAKCAVACGFKAAESEDEQGTCYIVDTQQIQITRKKEMESENAKKTHLSSGFGPDKWPD